MDQALSSRLVENENEEHWVSISDMMAGLMMVFLFISVLYMIQVQDDKYKIEQIAVTYQKMQKDLYQDLEEEFHEDLKKWNAVIDEENLSFRFREPDVLFAKGSEVIKPNFKKILDDFFPRYIKILMSPKFIKDIEEIRIEGHTSSEWNGGTDEDKAYILNMELSQSRTRSVLKYALNLPYIQNIIDKSWLKSHLTANGLSSSKLIKNSGNEDRKASRRVEFRVRNNAEKRIVEIINRD